MENDLICRGELLRKVQPDDESDEKAKISVKTAKNMMRTLTKSVPAVDAVIPVRCKDCEYVYEYQPAGCGRVTLSCENENAPWYTTEHAIFVEDNFYCKYGERRADHE